MSVPTQVVTASRLYQENDAATTKTAGTDPARISRMRSRFCES